MKITSLRLKNWKSYQDVSISQIPDLCVLVGANDSGKTGFFDALKFLKECLTLDLVTTLKKSGGFSEVLRRDAEAESVEIDIGFRLSVWQVETQFNYLLRLGLENGIAHVLLERLTQEKKVLLEFQNGKGTLDINFNREETELATGVLALSTYGRFIKFSVLIEINQALKQWFFFD